MLGDFSFGSVKTLLKLDLRSRFGMSKKPRAKEIAPKAMGILFFLLVYAALVIGAYFLSRMFIVRANLKIEFFTIATMVGILVGTVVSTGSIIKNLYMNGDNELLLRFPVSGKEILLSKSLYCMVQNLIVVVATLLPFYISFGIVTKASVGMYFAYIAVALYISIIPYVVANIIAVPVMKIMNGLKNQYLLMLLALIVIVVGLFVLYLTLLENVVQYLLSSKQNIFSSEMIAVYRNIGKYAFPFNFYSFFMVGDLYAGLSAGKMALNFLYTFLITGGLSVAAYFITTREYYKTILYGIQTEKTSIRRKSSNRVRSPFEALVRREFLNIYRSSNYSFQYFAMACAAPFMVFFSDRLASSVGTHSIGSDIVPGLTLLIIIIFGTISVSFASTSISREGGVFYQTKVIPVNYRSQVATKFFLYSIVAFISTTLSVLVAGIYFGTKLGGNILQISDILSIWGIAEVSVLSLTCISIAIDVKSPSFNFGGEGELVSANKNAAIALALGILMAVIYGVFVMIFTFVPFKMGSISVGITRKAPYTVIFVISALIFIASACGLFVNLEKKYSKIVP